MACWFCSSLPLDKKCVQMLCIATRWRINRCTPRQRWWWHTGSHVLIENCDLLQEIKCEG